MKYRIEFDSIGKIKVPGDKYWGASTERSNKYFNIGDFLVRPLVIHSIAIIKKAAAIVNTKNKDLDSKLGKYITKASEEVIRGKLDIHFPLKVWQTGSGTQSNMNVNEVLTELKEAIDKKDIKEVADALTDILYVTYGAGHAFGINLDKCFEEVQNSNMSKLDENGKPIYNDAGKVMKGPNYFKPDLSKFVY